MSVGSVVGRAVGLAVGDAVGEELGTAVGAGVDDEHWHCFGLPKSGSPNSELLHGMDVRTSMELDQRPWFPYLTKPSLQTQTCPSPAQIVNETRLPHITKPLVVTLLSERNVNVEAPDTRMVGGNDVPSEVLPQYFAAPFRCK